MKLGREGRDLKGWNNLSRSRKKAAQVSKVLKRIVGSNDGCFLSRGKDDW